MSDSGLIFLTVVYVVAMFGACWRSWGLGYKRGLSDGAGGRRS